MIDAKIRAVFFDAVGTLLFPRVPIHHTYAEIAGRHGIGVDGDQVRGAFRVAFARQETIDQLAGWKTNEERECSRWHAIVTEILAGPNGDECFADLWKYFSDAKAWTVHPDADTVFLHLSRLGLVLGIASNFDARLIRIINALPELAPIRDRCAISSLVGWRKPAAEFFAAIVELAGCRPDEILYVGDDLRNDVAGASAAGLQSILLDPQATASDSRRIRRLRDLLPA